MHSVSRAVLSRNLVTSESLLDPDFVRQLEALKRRLDVRARSGHSGERSSNRRGGAAEFAEHRPYAPGDDLRRMDWLAYARSGQPAVKLHRAEDDVVLRVLVDTSASLGFGDPPKLTAALRMSAAIGYLALAAGQRVQLLAAGARLELRAPRRGRRALSAWLRELAELAAGGKGELASAVDRALRTASRPGLLVVVSDFFDPSPVIVALSRARAAGHDIALVQVVAPEELAPELEGDWALVDSETGERVEVTMDAQAVGAYVLRLTGLVEELRSFARRAGATYVRLVSTESLEAPVRRFVGREVD